MIKKLSLMLIVLSGTQMVGSQADKQVPIGERLRFLTGRNHMHELERKRHQGLDNNNNNNNNNNRIIIPLPQVNTNIENYSAKPIFHRDFVESDNNERQQRLDEILERKKNNLPLIENNRPNEDQLPTIGKLSKIKRYKKFENERKINPMSQLSEADSQVGDIGEIKRHKNSILNKNNTNRDEIRVGLRKNRKSDEKK